MKLIHALIVASASILGSCSGASNEGNGPVLGKFDITAVTTDTVKVTEIFKDYRVICLETNDSCRVKDPAGKATTYLKFEDKFFVNSADELLIFSNEGKFERKLSRFLPNPTDYGHLYSYTVAKTSHGNEIIVGGDKRIWRYSLETLEPIGNFSVDSYTNTIVYVNDSTLLMAVNNHKELKIYTLDGRKRKEYLKRDPSLSLASNYMIQKVGDKYVYDIAATNDAVTYDPETDEFGSAIMCEPQGGLLTAQAAKEYAAQYGFPRWMEKIRDNFALLIDYRVVGDQVIAITNWPKDNSTVNFQTYNGKESANYTLWPKENAQVINDINPDDHPMFLYTFFATYSPDSFLFITDPDNQGDNLCIVEVKSLR